METAKALPCPPQKTQRRKRQQPPSNMTRREREEWRRRNNRAAAQDLRNRKKQYEMELQQSAEVLEAENRELEQRARVLEEQQAALQQHLGQFQQLVEAARQDLQLQNGLAEMDGDVTMTAATAPESPAEAHDTPLIGTTLPARNATAVPAAYSPQQQELQRMAPVLVMLLGAALSQPWQTVAASLCPQTSQTSAPATSSSSPRRQRSLSSSSSEQDLLLLEEEDVQATRSRLFQTSSSGTRRSRRIAQKSEAIQPPPLSTSAGTGLSSASPAQTPLLSPPSPRHHQARTASAATSTATAAPSSSSPSSLSEGAQLAAILAALQKRVPYMASAACAAMHAQQEPLQQQHPQAPLSIAA